MKTTYKLGTKLVTFSNVSSVNSQKDLINNILSNISKPVAGLYIVSTPIGNLEDITLRALKLLSSCDLIACEDTRVSSKLLKSYDINTRLIGYNDYSNNKDRDKILNLIKNGKAVALVSDAGTPLISDPGYKLVKKMQEENLKIFSIPGASSVVSALTLSGLPTDNFIFEGFLPSKSQSRINYFEKIAKIKTTYVFFDSAKRVVKTLEDIRKTIPNAQICILRELTKKFEEAKFGNAEYLIDYYTENPPKGEIVIVLYNDAIKEISDDELRLKIEELSKTMRSKDIAHFLAEEYSLNKKEIYQKVISIKDSDG